MVEPARPAKNVDPLLGARQLGCTFEETYIASQVKNSIMAKVKNFEFGRPQLKAEFMNPDVKWVVETQEYVPKQLTQEYAAPLAEQT